MSLLISVLILLGAWVYFPKTMLVIVAVCTIVMIYFMWEVPLFDDLEQSNEQKEMIPFDLEAAKRGEPIVTRDGRKVEFIAHLENKNISHPVTAYVHETAGACSFTEDGVFFKGKDNCFDLFMAPKPKVTMWVNTVEHSSDLSSIGHIYRSEDAAISAAAYYPTTGEAILIEIDDIF